jgi:hypothetical protein
MILVSVVSEEYEKEKETEYETFTRGVVVLVAAL